MLKRTKENSRRELHRETVPEWEEVPPQAMELAEEVAAALDNSGFLPASDEHIAREKRLAQELRGSRWWQEQLAGGVCHYCGKKCAPSELTMDHVIPIIRGGFSTKDNVVVCCKDCNSSKKYLLLSEWRRE